MTYLSTIQKYYKKHHGLKVTRKADRNYYDILYNNGFCLKRSIGNPDIYKCIEFERLYS